MIYTDIERVTPEKKGDLQMIVFSLFYEVVVVGLILPHYIKLNLVSLYSAPCC